MPNTIFEIDRFACLLLLGFAAFLWLLHRWAKGFSSPRLLYSSMADFQMPHISWREYFSHLPRYLLIASLILFGAAFIDPHVLIKKTKIEETPLRKTNMPTEGIAMYLVLDQSGSMGEKAHGSQTKMDLLKSLTSEFVKGNPAAGLQGRPSDMIGLVSFARGASVLVPLTLDHEEILKKLAKLEVVRSEEEDGTSIGYAIFKTANLIAATRHFAEDLAENGKPAYTIKSAVIILVTDGFQSPSPLDKDKRLRNIDLVEAAEYAKQENIKLYIINVEPRLAKPEFAAYGNLMQQVANITGGSFYFATTPAALGRIYVDIDRLEKSALPIQQEYELPLSRKLQLYRRVSFYPYLIAAGMAFLFLSMLLHSTVFRRVP